jgi:hypothetical protein
MPEVDAGIVRHFVRGFHATRWALDTGEMGHAEIISPFPGSVALSTV